jgi:hypothetical protein
MALLNGCFWFLVQNNLYYAGFPFGDRTDFEVVFSHLFSVVSYINLLLSAVFLLYVITPLRVKKVWFLCLFFISLVSIDVYYMFPLFVEYFTTINTGKGG